MHRVEDAVYVIDPDDAVHDALTALLGAGGRKVVCFPTAEAFLGSGAANDATSGCILLEANLPGMGSLALLRQLRQQGIELPIVVLTSTSDRDIADQALMAGAFEVIEKPLVSDRLLELLCGLAATQADL